MKKLLTNLGGLSLSQEQMKNIKGGQLDNCAVCSWAAGGHGTCGSYTFSNYDASLMAIEFNLYNDGYTYVVNCQ